MYVIILYMIFILRSTFIMVEPAQQQLLLEPSSSKRSDRFVTIRPHDPLL
jgi:hypothetical protein